MLDHRAPAPVRNHARDNVLAMREKMRQQRGKSIVESMKLAQPEVKPKQFANVKSRLFDLPRPTPNDKLVRSRSSPCGRPGSQQVEKKDTAEGEEGAEDEEMDLASFEREVERLKREHGTKPAPAVQEFKKDSARRPAYLQKIKTDLAEQQHQSELARRGPQIPEGYRQMPENERQETLEALEKKREELEKAFQRLPLVIETAAQRKRQETVLRNIKDSDAAIKTFSNPMMLVQI